MNCAILQINNSLDEKAVKLMDVFENILHEVDVNEIHQESEQETITGVNEKRKKLIAFLENVGYK